MPQTHEEEKARARAYYAARKAADPKYRTGTTEEARRKRRQYLAKKREDPEYLERVRERQRNYQRKYQKKIRKGEHIPEWFARLRGKQTTLLAEFRKDGCLVCGEDDPICLLAHHIDPAAKEFNIGALQTASANRLAAELAKCGCLCHNCHFRLHAGRFCLRAYPEFADSHQQIKTYWR